MRTGASTLNFFWRDTPSLRSGHAYGSTSVTTDSNGVLLTDGRECLFGEVTKGEMVLNERGLLAKNEWQRLEKQFNTVNIDEFIIMPNHVYGTVWIPGAGQGNRMIVGESTPAPPLRRMAGFPEG